MMAPCRRSSTAILLLIAANMVDAARGRAALAPGVFADVIFVGQLDVALLDGMEDHLGGHQLHHAGRRPQLVGVLLEQHAAACGFDQDRGRRVAVETALLLLGALHAVVGGMHDAAPADRERDRGRNHAAPRCSGSRTARYWTGMSELPSDFLPEARF